MTDTIFKAYLLYFFRSRRENKVKAEQLLAQGNTAAAHAHIQKAVDVTPMMAAKLIAALRKAGVEYVVAPYEADAQMAYLDRTGAVAAVITEDSDLLLFGCKRVLFKLDRDAFVDEICTSRLTEVTEMDFTFFPFSKVFFTPSPSC